MWLCARKDPCGSAPCQHGGTCTNTGSKYTCSCRPIFKDSNYQTFGRWKHNVCTLLSATSIFIVNKPSKDSDNNLSQDRGFFVRVHLDFIAAIYKQFSKPQARIKDIYCQRISPQDRTTISRRPT